MRHSINFVDENYKEITKKMMEEFTNYQPKSKYTIRWKLDSTKYSFIDFKGYEAGKNQVKFLVNRDFSMTETNLLPEK
jgi:hypothetical protein